MKTFVINLIVLIFLYLLLCIPFYLMTLNPTSIAGDQSERYDTNTIRATYPNYDNMAEDKATSLFTEFAAPSTGYQPFIAYRRKAFTGQSVTITARGFRHSTNHQIGQSYWFLGGSTMWGTGAEDAHTIPSYFAESTGQPVLNLGESGFVAFQELIQTQLLMMKGYRPKAVVFYDGVNDGYYHCLPDAELPTHAYTSRYREYIENYARYKTLAESKAESVIAETRLWEFLRAKLGQADSWLWAFVGAPFVFFQQDTSSGESTSNALLDTSVPFAGFEPKSRVLHCDDADTADRVATLLVSTWLHAFELFSAMDIPVFFVLQPSAANQPERYELDHLIVREKQRISDQAASYAVLYEKIRRQWLSRCAAPGACGRFVDLSDRLFDLDEALFIDDCHLSYRGNEIIARSIAAAVDGSEQPAIAAGN